MLGCSKIILNHLLMSEKKYFINLLILPVWNFWWDIEHTDKKVICSGWKFLARILFYLFFLILTWQPRNRRSFWTKKAVVSWHVTASGIAICQQQKNRYILRFLSFKCLINSFFVFRSLVKEKKSAFLFIYFLLRK